MDFEAALTNGSTAIPVNQAVHDKIRPRLLTSRDVAQPRGVKNMLKVSADAADVPWRGDNG
jgi:hypothetical protein